MIFTIGRDELTPSAEFAQYVEHKLLIVQDDALIAWLAMGIIPVCFVRNVHNDEVYPQVPAWGSYTITIESVLGTPILKFYWASMTSNDCGGITPQFRREEQSFNIPGQGIMVARGAYRSDGSCSSSTIGTGQPAGWGREDPTVAIIGNLGHDPSLDGTINSVMASIFEDYIDYNRAMRRDAIVAGARAARPPIATEYNPALDQLLSKKAVELGHFVGSNVLMPDNEAGTAQRRTDTYKRTPEEQEAQRDQYRLIAATMGSVALEQYGVTAADIGQCKGETTHEFSDTIGIDEVKVRDDRKLSSAVPKPEIRSDIVPAIHANDEAIAAAFGLSLAMLNGDVTAATSGTELSNKGMNRTRLDLHRTMSSFMTIVYDHIFLEQDVFELLADRVRMRPGEALHSASDLFDDPAASLDVRVTYRFTPDITMDDLRFLKGRGIIDYRKYATCALQMQGLTAADVATPDDPLDEETGRALDIPEYLKLMEMRSAEKMKDKEMKNANVMKEREIESTAELREREMANDREMAAEKPSPKKAKKK